MSSRLCYSKTYFNPLPPCGGRRILLPNTIVTVHFNPLPPCGGRLYGAGLYVKATTISIHSFRAEGDKHIKEVIVYVQKFQSTPSVRRETKVERPRDLIL